MRRPASVLRKQRRAIADNAIPTGAAIEEGFKVPCIRVTGSGVVALANSHLVDRFGEE
jgi:hypothetical protein